MEELKITETYIVEKIKEFLINKERGNWHEDKTIISNLHGHGADIRMAGGKSNTEKFVIECKGKSYAKSARSINREGWLNALGQIITRMNTKRTISSGIQKGNINRAYKYGLGLYWESAQVALRRIPKTIAQTLNLYIFSCNDAGVIKMFTPSEVGKEYSKSDFNI